MTKREINNGSDTDDDFFALGSFQRKKKKGKSNTVSKEPGVVGHALNKVEISETHNQIQVIDIESTLDNDSVIIMVSSPIGSPQGDINSDEEEDNVYEGILSSIDQLTQKSVESYEFTDTNELNRNYILEVVPKLENAQPYSFKTKGANTFDDIMDSVLSYYKQTKQISRKIKKSDLSFFWITGQMEIKSFFKPLTLRIPPLNDNELKYIDNIGYTIIRCFLLPTESVGNAKLLYGDTTNFSFDHETKDTTFKQSSVDDSNDSSQPTLSSKNMLNEEDVDYFVIGLKGKDNKRLEVKVNADTKIEKLLDYYLSKKNIDKAFINVDNVKLIFDDEQLDLNASVGDTELEQDFEVQIFLD